MGNICQNGTHIIVQLEAGHALHQCAECGQKFMEHHELQILVGAGAAPAQVPPASQAPTPPH